MARQSGPKKITGSVGGIRHFQLPGLDGYFASKAPVVSPSRYAHDPAFARVRENNNELVGATKMAVLLREGVYALFSACPDRKHLFSRMNGALRLIVNFSPGVRGARPVGLSANRGMLEGFEFSSMPFRAGFRGGFSVAASTSRNGVVVSVPGFVPGQVLTPPAGASHFLFRLVVCGLSDMRFDDDYGWVPAGGVGHGVSVGVDSGLLDVGAAGVPGFSLSGVLPGVGVLDAGVSLVVGLGVVFYQVVNGERFLMGDGVSGRIVQVL